MKIKNISIMLLSLILSAGVMSCTKVKKGEYVEGAAALMCDDGFKNIILEEIDVFEYSYPKSSILPSFVSEQDAIDSMMNDATQCIIVTKELTKEQREYIRKKHKRVVKTHCIAVDAVALITNKDNNVTSLSMSEISDIMNGKITRWSQLAGNDTTSIKLVFDNANSSTVSYMKSQFLSEGAKISDNPNAFAQQNNAQVFDVVKKDKNALGIISVSWLGDNLEKAKSVPVEDRNKNYAVQNDTIATELTTEVNVVKVSNPTEKNDFNPVAYKPYQVYIYSGEYPLFRKVYMISTASNHSLLHSFYAFVTGFVGQKIISSSGILPFHMNPRVVELVNNNNSKSSK